MTLRPTNKWIIFLAGVVFFHLSYMGFAEEAVVNNDSSLLTTDKKAWDDRMRIRDFVLFNYAHIADNIINGKGAYLETLYELLNIGNNEREACRQHLKALLLERERIPDFSSSIAAYNKEI